jgi:hypothetical protein
LLVGSGVSLVANAATNFWPSNFEDWQRENLFVAGTGGNVLDLRGDPPKLGSAVKQITLVGGRTYRITGTLIWRPSFSDSRITIGLITGNDEEVILCYFDGVSRNIEVDVEFTVPSNNQVEMAILIYGRSTVTFNDFVLEDDSTDKGILNSIKEGFAKLWEWLKGIWDSIKEIPTKIAASLTTLGDRIKDFFSSLGDRIGNFFTDLWDRIKAFFLPSEGFFDEYSAKFNVFIDSHFGFLADLPDELSILFSTFINYHPADVPSLQIPEVVVPIPGHPIKLLESQTYTFDLLSRSPYSMLYSFYKAFVWFAYALMLFNLLRRKYAVIFGGASDNAD